MDDLVYICTKIARQMDVSGLDRVFDAAEAATAAVEEARPLITRVTELVDEVCAWPVMHADCKPAGSVAVDEEASGLGLHGLCIRIAPASKLALALSTNGAVKHYRKLLVPMWPGKETVCL